MNRRMVPTLALRRLPTGFSLMEMAVVLMIIGILMSGVLVSISQTTLNARRAAALAQLQQVEEALYGYAEAMGRLPCPASATSGGYEDVTGPSCLKHGFVPSATLGIYGQTDGAGLLLDAWGNPLRYSLASTANLVDLGNPDFSDKTSIKSFFGNSYAFTAPPFATNMLQVCDDSSCSGTVMSYTAPAVVMSMGENWASSSSANEITNAGLDSLGGHKVHASTDLIFVSADYSDENFDDQLVWLSPYVLFNRMVSAGKLP